MSYVTVSQYAALIGKDPSVVRRLLASGKIKGEKIGSQWVLQEDTEYPIDKRVKSGNYKNWRKTSDVRKANPELMKALSKMSKEIGGIFGDIAEKIVLYGSYARGEETTESDVDLAVILNTPESEDEHNAMVDLVVDYELEIGITLSVITVEYQNYLNWKNVLPFYKNMDKEGIVLWKAA